MKLRADLAAMIVAGLTVVAITVLAVDGRTIPEVLSTIALVVVGGGVGIAAPLLGAGPAAALTPGATDTADAVTALAGRVEDLLAHAETSTGHAQAAARAAVRAAQAVTEAPAPVPAPYTPPATSYATSTTGGAA